jgi:hypothetical protein
VNCAREQSLEELALAKDDQRLIAHTQGQVVEPLDRLRRTHEPHEEQRAPGKERSGDSERRRERNGAGECRYAPRAFLSSAVIAGTTSCRFPITA